MPRVVLSWLNDFLARPVTAADADRYLGEAGIAVTRVSSPGAGDPRVVVGRVEAQPPESDCCVTASVPTPERVSAPAGPPPPGTLVAVALPGAQLFDPRGRQGVRRIDRSRHDPSPVGLICTAADLGLGHDSGPYTLPDGSRPGTPVAQVLPPGPRAEVLQVTVPDTFVHAAGLWGLAGELAPRAGTARVTPRSDGTAAPPDGLAVDRPGWTVSASVVAHDGPSPALERIRPQATLAGLWSNDALGDALNVTAFEYGVRLAAFPAGDAGVRAVVGGSALAAAPAAELGWPVELPVAVEGARDPASRLLVLAAAPTEAADGGARCRAAVQRLAELLSPCRTGPVGSIPVTATGPASPPIRVHIGLSEIADVVGVALRPAEIAGLLARIGALVEPLAGGWLSVAIPASRSDLTAGAELMAEIVRLLGFRRLPPTVPADPVVVDRDTRRARRERARAAVVASGYQELVTPLAVDARPGRPNDAGRELLRRRRQRGAARAAAPPGARAGVRRGRWSADAAGPRRVRTRHRGATRR
ncbi:hypothetical protein OHA72_57340 [Dactylosporangium sp. NBC_01737]|uniref:hypothetical protein n=1 Tax=Dactylosporangium sp. NBC_01737 TaxID=2975959 RepID=UPI002E15D3C9|nr:hypothetical protein OHA72_57340 [Dactylosporangium sp. NBC_01737]